METDWEISTAPRNETLCTLGISMEYNKYGRSSLWAEQKYLRLENEGELPFLKRMHPMRWVSIHGLPVPLSQMLVYTKVVMHSFCYEALGVLRLKKHCLAMGCQDIWKNSSTPESLKSEDMHEQCDPWCCFWTPRIPISLWELILPRVILGCQSNLSPPPPPMSQWPSLGEISHLVLGCSREIVELGLQNGTPSGSWRTCYNTDRGTPRLQILIL